MTTQRTQPSTDDSVVASTDITESVLSDKVGREALGLLLVSFGVLGGLGALVALHWTAGLSAALIGLCASGVLVRRNSTRRWQQDAGAIAAFSGYAGQVAVLFYLLPPLGWLAVSVLVVATGLWISSAEGA
ncbi:hypothetical protein ACFU96_21095 [Streptomyces sp. NPDC057620]|uniref:hypothetical protein n=1 Tax=Streptomyces sp. NPDC057620 TaxID=3346185 RepID=UPI0036A6ABA3